MPAPTWLRVTRTPPKVVRDRAAAIAWGGSFVTMAILALLTTGVSQPLMLGSFGATCVLVFGYPALPFARPRNVIFGHGISSLVGLLCLNLLGATWWSVAIGVSTSLAGMMLTGTTHPPAGSNPVIIFLTTPSWSFLLVPTLVGAAIVVVVGLIYNNVVRNEPYPMYW